LTDISIAALVIPRKDGEKTPLWTRISPAVSTELGYIMSIESAAA